MALPGFQSLMLPILKILQDGNEIRRKDIRQRLAQELELTSDDFLEELPSGRRRYRVRIAYTLTNLMSANLIERPEHGRYRITEAGKKELEKNPDRIDMPYLRSIPAFQQSPLGQSSKRRVARDLGDGQISEDQSNISEATPEEQIAYAIEDIETALKRDLREQIDQNDPYFFERLVVDLLEAMGYGRGTVTQRTRDGGIDGVINEDRLGISKIYLQAKRHSSQRDSIRVSERDLRGFSGALDKKQTQKGVFITTSKFSPDAEKFVNDLSNKSIVLIDGDKLLDLMIEYGVGVAQKTVHKTWKIDMDYFEGE